MPTNKPIKFLDLKDINSKYSKELIDASTRVISSGWYILGNELQTFEKKYADYCNTKYCIGVSNGLDALRLILKAYKELGILKDQDEVIVPANTFIATVLAITDLNLIPIFIEPNPETFNIDSTKIRNKISNKTKAIITVHLYGQISIDYLIKNLCKEFNLLLIEDCAQSQGAIWNGKKSGNIGDAGAHSFYPGKNLGALGDAGAITTNDKKLSEVLYSLRNYGSKVRYLHEFEGLNSRMDEIQAAFLLIKLNFLDQENKLRREIANNYLKLINNPKIKLPTVLTQEQHVWHLFVIQTQKRNQLIEYLKANHIESLIHYPIPPHKQIAYRKFNNLELPISEKLATEILSIPLNIGLSKEEIQRIIDTINKY